jgi:diguanylate cyclase (GGDEF)-like protein/PAS domain S-box-containing protein
MTSWWPSAAKRATRLATSRMRSGLPIEVPPYFWTISDKGMTPCKSRYSIVTTSHAVKRYLPPQSLAWIVLAFGVAAAVGAWHYTARQSDSDARAEFESRANLAASLVDRKVQRYIDLLYGMEALFGNDPSVSRVQFQGFITALDAGRRFPGVQALEFVRRVPAASRDDFEKAVRDDHSLVPGGYPDFSIQPPGGRPEYYVIDYVEPMLGNESAFGLDIRTRAAALSAAENSRDSGEPVLTGRYRLIQERGASTGLVAYLPVFGQGMPRTVEARRQALVGFVNVVFRVDDLFADTLTGTLLEGLSMEIHDQGTVNATTRADPDTETLIFRASAADASELEWLPDTLVTSVRRHEAALVVAGRQWRVAFQSSPAANAGLQPLPLFVLATGLIVSLLLFGILRTLARSRGEALEAADHATSELRGQLATNQELEAITRDSNERLRAVIQSAPFAILARDFDANLQIWNPAGERMFGRTEEEMRRPEVSIVPEHLRAQTTAYRERARGGELIVIEETQRMHKDGHLIDVSLSIAPVFDSTGRVNATMVTIADITQRKLAEQALRDSEARLRLAMEAAQMGMWYWDIETDLFTYSDGLGPLFGLERDAPLIPYPELQLLLHDEDRPLFLATMRHAVKEGAGFQLDYRVVWPDGSVHWIANRGQVLRREDGRALRLVGVAMEFTERKLAEQRIAHMAQHDALTGLPNRLLLNDRIQQAIAHAHRNKSRLAVLFIDLDRFKTINDSLGHQLGDRLLQSVAHRIHVCLREGDTVSRLGGDEFVIVLPVIESGSDASAVATKLLEVLSSSFHLHGNDLHVSASMGISLYPGDGTDVETLMRNADTAMYHAKDSGRSQFQFFTPEMNVVARERLTLETALRRGIEANEFELHYQPVIAVAGGHVGGVEALVRWRSPDRGLVMPADFIAAAEESGFIVTLGEWVLKEALAQARLWQDAGRRLRVAVNVSASQLRRRNFVDRLRKLLEDSGVQPARIVLEITEGVIVESAGEAIATLAEISALGVRLAIDDFGTGYSGLAYLKRFPIDTVKIDQSFVRDLTVDADDAAIVTAIIAMARSLGLSVVAEGVENAAQMDMLERMGCENAQGYHLAKPMTASELEDWLAHRDRAAAD